MSRKSLEQVMEEPSVLDALLKDRDSIESADSTETVEKPKKKRSKYVSVRHNSSDNYKDPNKAAELGIDLFPGGFSREMGLAAIERGRKNFYLIGLDEKGYSEEWEKEFLRESIPALVENFGEEVLDPFAMDFWKTRNLSINQEETVLDLDNPDDLLTYWNIKGGGYPYIAKSPDELLRVQTRFFLEEPHLTYEVNDDGGKLQDKAVAILSNVNDSANGFSTLFFLHKNLITSQEGITFNTPKSIIYTALRRFINGDYSGSKKKLAPKQFIEAYNIYKTNNKRSRTSAIVNDALFYGTLSTNKDSQFINNETSFNFKTTDKNKLIDSLMSPANQEELISLMEAVQQKWNKY